MANSVSTRFLTPDDFGEWDALVDGAGASVFHKSAFLTLVAPFFDREAKILGIYSGKRLLGGWPLHTRKRFGLAVANPPLIGGYCGPVLNLPEYKSTGRTLSETLQLTTTLTEAVEERFAYARFVADPQVRDIRPMHWNGWKILPRYTTRIRLTAEDEIAASLRKSLRRRLRRCEEAGITVEPVSEIDDVASAYAESYTRTGDDPPVDPAIIADVTRRAVAAGLAQCYVASGDGEPYAFQVLFHDENRCYAWVAGSFTAHIATGAFPYLLWSIIRESVGRYESFDFMGANTPAILDFKQSFGGDLVPYWEGYRATRTAGLLLRGLEAVRRVRG